MKLSEYYFFTSKEDPSYAKIRSHKLMLRSGMIKQSTSGIYSWLPLGLLVLKKIEKIIRDFHKLNNIHEILMPTIQSAELWKKSGRYNDYGKEMLKIKDRHDTDLLYGPTNEELITDIIAKDIKSYRELPQLLYHMQWKFRDELRPRFGVMRCREFLMKDAYSFDIDFEEAEKSYKKMFLLYMQIFKALGLRALPFQAETGPIGGSLSHEFIIESNSGESDVFFDTRAFNIKFDKINLNDEEKVESVVGDFSKYYCSTSEKYNEKEFFNSVPQKHRKISKGIEIGHIFYFGTKYSEKLNACYLNQKGKKIIIHSGSYGIGVTRLVGAIIEANNDEKGIVWPKEVSPFQIGLINIRQDNDISTEYCNNFYHKYSSKFDILYDDRAIRVGEKLYDQDLLGLPLQIIVGERNLKNDNLEVKNRKTGKIDIINKEKIDKFLFEKYEY